jgi:plasmid stabilization system protein ParE
MKFKIIWSDYAESQLDKIFEYYTENASPIVAKNLIQEIIAEPNKLLKSPEISQVEDLLLDRETLYRYLICKNYKIIYSVDEKGQFIQIADVFDTRQNPQKIKRTK